MKIIICYEKWCNEKGVIIEVYDLSIKKTIYFYNYDNFRTVEEFKIWEEKIIDEVLETENYEYNATTLETQ